MVMSANQRDPQYKLRWSEELRDRITQSAKEHNRSINADIIARLEASFKLDQAKDQMNDYFSVNDKIVEGFKRQEEILKTIVTTLVMEKNIDEELKNALLSYITKKD